METTAKKVKEEIQPPLALVLSIDGKPKKLPLDQFANDGFADEAAACVNEAEGPVSVSLESLLDWPATQRFDALDFLNSLDSDLRFDVGQGKEEVDDLFEAVLTLLVDNQNLDRFKAGRAAALEAEALMHEDALDGACDRIAERLRGLGVKGVSRRDLLRSAQRIVRDLYDGDGDEDDGGERPVTAAIDGAPVADEILVPQGWKLSAKGVSKSGESVAVTTPVLIIKRHLDINDKTELVTLAWERDGEWRERTVQRTVIANSRAIVDELAGYGLPVTTNNAKTLIQYLADFEATNLGALPTVKVSRQLGWQGDGGKEGFLWGGRLITGDGPAKEAKSEQAIQFRGSDEGDEQIAAGFHARGTFEKWQNAIAKLEAYPKARLALYASFVPPILTILDSPNSVVDLPGRTSSGKTGAIRVGASVWGNPDERSTASVLKTWDVTSAWRERAASVLNNLPLILDDTKHARHPDEIAKTIYAVAQGVGRGRGTTKGLARQETCRTVLLTTGEQPVTSHTQDGGTRPRVLSVWGSPFEKTDAATGKLVRRLVARVSKNYGHAGPLFVGFLIENRASWSEWRKEYRTEVVKYEQWAAEENNTFAGRMAAMFAAVTTTAWLVHSAEIVPWEYSDPIEPLWDELVAEAGEANRAAAALRYVMDWAYAHQNEFYGRTEKDYQPHGGWAGRWDKSHPLPLDPGQDGDDWHWIGFIPARLEALLRDGGFEPESIIRSWRDDGWLHTNNGSDGQSRRTYRTRVGEERRGTHLIAVKKAAVELVYGEIGP